MRLPALLLLLVSMAAFAELSETLSYKTYPTKPKAEESLLQALDSATPIHQDGKTYHGYTAWNIQWQFKWYRESNERCSITQSKTRLTAEITLPELASSEERTRVAFSKYSEALRRHELGHVQIARSAARKIDTGILSLPAMNSCALLEQTANELGHQGVEQAKQEGRRYDEVSGHGRTQGAWLPR